MIKVDKHLLKKTDYDVKLVNGTKIEFNNAGEWTSIDCKKKSVPAELVPKHIRRKVAKDYILMPLSPESPRNQAAISSGFLTARN